MATNEDSTTSQAGGPAVHPPLRLMWPTIVLVLYWVAVEGSYRFEMAMLYRFLSRMAAFLILLLFFLSWGMTRRHFRFRTRILMFVVLLGGLIVAGILGDPTTGVFSTGLVGLPYALTIATILWWFLRDSRQSAKVAAVAAAACLAFGPIALLRWEGLDGRQRPVMSWRWTKSAEDRFLESMRDAPSPGVTRSDSAHLVAHEYDWTSFRGGNHDSQIVGQVLGDWSRQPPVELWRRRVGPSWSSVIVVGDHLFTQEQRSNHESVVCYDLHSGAELWTCDFAVRFEEPLSGVGPRATPTFADGKILAAGGKGLVVCMNASDGQQIWSRDLVAESGAVNQQWGYSTSPLVVDDQVIAFVGAAKKEAHVSLDLTTGSTRWSCPGGTINYSSPQWMTLCGVPQVVLQDDSGIYSMQIEDGTELWRHSNSGNSSLQPMLQPHLVGDSDMVLGWGAGTCRLHVSFDSRSWSVDEIWNSNRLKPSFNDFVIQGDCIYGLDDGILACIHLEDGSRLWKGGRYGFGQILSFPDAKELLITSESGELVRVAANPSEHQEIARFPALSSKTWNHPVLAHGMLIVRNAEEMVCFSVSPVQE